MSNYGNYPNPQLCKKYGCWLEGIEIKMPICMGCPGCLLTAKEMQEKLENLTAEAKKHAINEQTIYIIYLHADGRPDYMAYQAAQEAGITPIKFISHLIPITNG